LPVLGTNGVLLTPSRARELVDCGLQGVGLSIDSLDAGKHDDFRGVPGAWRRTVSAIGTCQRLGLAVQIHTTATRANHVEIPELIEFAVDRGVDAFNLFFLVCTGRGQKMTDIGPARYEALLRLLATTQETYRGRMLIRARCAPHYLRLVHGHGAELAAATAGCMAGTEYLRVTPEADVTPCPYLPIVAGNLRVDSLASICESAPVLNELRSPKLTGRCGACEYGRVCGGCRARAFATTGDLMAEDPWCDYEPGQLGPMALADLGPETAGEPEWSEEARGRLDRVPVALRPVVERGVVAYARSKGLGRITPELMREMRSRVGRMGTLSKHSSPPGE